MTRIRLDDIEENRRHWYREEHFARQLGNPSARAIVEGRWRLLAKEIRLWIAAQNTGKQGESAQNTLHVLDAGCGDGINLVGLSQIFADLGQAISLTGIDYNELRIERARGLGLDCRLQVGTLEATGLDHGSIDIVLLNHVLEHIPKKDAVLAELRRVMRPGGLLIVGVPNEGCALAKLRNHVLQRSVLRTTDHVHFFTASSLRRDLTAAGFGVASISGEGFFVPHLRLAGMIGGTAGGRRLLDGLRTMMPSQAAGLIAIAHAGVSAQGR
jgi:2-polyprenyl-3-methyl-5-hydroxy-6-metoxy-1,4-benzoquinol methylase